LKRNDNLTKVVEPKICNSSLQLSFKIPYVLMTAWIRTHNPLNLSWSTYWAKKEVPWIPPSDPQSEYQRIIKNVTKPGSHIPLFKNVSHQEEFFRFIFLWNFSQLGRQKWKIHKWIVINLEQKSWTIFRRMNSKVWTIFEIF